jgi:exonuclease SbcD
MMRILHTSDWHLGQNFFTHSRKAEHHKLITWLMDIVAREQINAMIIAGDIFDTGAPPSYARELYHQLVIGLQQLDCQLIVVAGNHDSVSVLNESKALLAHLNASVIADTNGPLEQQIIELKNSDGELGALVCAVPFVRARDILKSRSGMSGDEKKQDLSNAIEQHYADIYAVALEKRNALNVDVPIVGTGHLTAIGSSKSESVRDIYIGTLDGFAANQFPAMDYIALGHIHRSQRVGKCEHIRYCGSPIPLSFDEVNTTKQVNLIQFSDGKAQIESIEIPAFRSLINITGSFDEIVHQLIELSKSTQEEDLALWVSITMTSDEIYSEVQKQLNDLIKEKKIEILQIRRSKREPSLHATAPKQTLAELSPFEVFEQRINNEEFDGEQAQLKRTRVVNEYKQIVEEIQLEAAATSLKVE